MVDTWMHLLLVLILGRAPRSPVNVPVGSALPPALGPTCSVPLCWGLGKQAGRQPYSMTRALGFRAQNSRQAGESRTTAWTDAEGSRLPQLPPQKSRVFWEGFLEETMGRSLAGGALWGLPRLSPRGLPILLACQTAPGQAGLGPGSPHLQVGVLTLLPSADWPPDDGRPAWQSGGGLAEPGWKSKFPDDPGRWLCTA